MSTASAARDATFTTTEGRKHAGTPKRKHTYHLGEMNTSKRTSSAATCLIGGLDRVLGSTETISDGPVLCSRTPLPHLLSHELGHRPPPGDDTPLLHSNLFILARYEYPFGFGFPVSAQPTAIPPSTTERSSHHLVMVLEMKRGIINPAYLIAKDAGLMT